MPRCHLLLLALALAPTVGCDRQQPAKRPPFSGSSAAPASSTKPSSGDPATPSGQPSAKVSPEVQQPSRNVEPVAQGPRIELGYSEQRPVLFFELRAGSVIHISEIRHDQLGWVVSYDASVRLAKGDQVKVLVQIDTPAGGGKAPTHAATVNGKPVPRQRDKELVGFSVKDPGGVVLARGGEDGRLNMQTKFSYDPTGRQNGSEQIAQQDGKTFAIVTKFAYGSTGRQYLAQQDVQLEGKTFTIAYSDYRWEESGRLASYTARVVKAE